MARLGRKSRLRESQRASIWEIFEQLKGDLRAESWITEAEMFMQLAKTLEQDNSGAYDHAIVDEAQDVSVSELRFWRHCVDLAKGLEYRAIAVMACDDEILPLQERIASAADDSDLEEILGNFREGWGE